MAKKPSKDLESTKALMGALLRQPPKQHGDMKIGSQKKKKPGKRRASKTTQ
jgi:hypothetical protein